MCTKEELDKFSHLDFMGNSILIKVFRNLDFEKTDIGVYDPKYKTYTSTAGKMRTELDRDLLRLTYRGIVVNVPRDAKRKMDEEGIEVQPMVGDIVWIKPSALSDHGVFMSTRDSSIYHQEGYFWLHSSLIEARDNAFRDVLNSDYYDKIIEKEEKLLEELEQKRLKKLEEAEKEQQLDLAYLGDEESKTPMNIGEDKELFKL